MRTFKKIIAHEPLRMDLTLHLDSTIGEGFGTVYTAYNCCTSVTNANSPLIMISRGFRCGNYWGSDVSRHRRRHIELHTGTGLLEMSSETGIGAGIKTRVGTGAGAEGGSLLTTREDTELFLGLTE